MTAALQAEDARIAKEQEISEKATKDAATAASSTDPRPPAAEEVAKESVQPEQVGDPMGANEQSATDRAPMDISNHGDSAPHTTNRANKKSRPASDAQRQVDERAPAQHRNISSPGGDPDHKRPRVPEPSSPTVSYKSDEPEDEDMEDRKILSSVLRGVDITEVFAPTCRGSLSQVPVDQRRLI